MVRQKIYSKSAFTIIELVLVLVIVVVVSTISGMNYYQAVKNARVETAAQQIIGLIQEARSLAMSNKKPTTDTIAYKVTIFRNTTDNTIETVYANVIENGGGSSIKSFITVPRITYEDEISTPTGFLTTGNTIRLHYNLPDAQLQINDSSANKFVSLSFNIKDELTGRKVKISLNTISGLIETELLPS